MHRQSNLLLLSSVCFILCAVSPALAQFDVEAIAGRPFGVGRATIRVAPRAGEPLVPLADDRFALQDAQGRVLYSTLDQAPVRRLLRQILELNGPQQVTFYFLFQGDAPLDLTLYAPTPYRATVRPVANDRQYGRLLGAWWKQYAGDVRRMSGATDYPLMIENYLLPTLSRRLNLEIPRRLDTGSSADNPADALGLVFGSEDHRAAIAREMLLGLNVDTGKANLPLPEPLPAVELPLPEFAADVELEPLTKHVPAECFYVRFGNFNNYLWMREFLSRWGGDLRNMIVVRGFDYALNTKSETQLSLKENKLSKVMGPTVIADVAMIGSDLFMREGAGFGMLFHARNNFALSNDIEGQYAAVLDSVKDAKLEKVPMEGQQVLFLHTPDNRIRSFYAVDGDFHLVTTSRTIARRFLQVSQGQGKGSLSELAEFKYARSILPVERKHAIFAYLSEPFMRQFVTPHYRIEMRRRTQSLIEMDSLRLARLAAKAEGKNATTIDELVTAGLLPYGFSQRSDGSALIERDGEMLDSVRGAQGTFLPIIDLETVGVNRQELGSYERFAAAFQSGWKRMDPIAVGIGREILNETGLERMSIEAHVTPHVPSHFAQAADFLGPPTHEMIPPIKGDIISGQVATSGKGLFGIGGGGSGNILFGAIRDFSPPLLVENNTVMPGRREWELIRGYLGAWPNPGILGIFLGQNGGQIGPDGVGPAGALGLQGFQARRDDFLLLTFKRDVLAEVLPQLAIVEANRPAQVRIRVEDVSGAQLYQALSALGYMRSRQTSSSGARLMNILADQLHVPPEDCLRVAEELVDARLVCSLGGEFKLVELPGGRKAWTSTALPAENQFVLSSVPEEYQLPVLKWFRGATFEGLLAEGDLVVWADIDMQLEPIEAGTDGDLGGGFSWPKWDSFSLPFGGGKKKPEAKPMEELPPPEPLPAPKSKSKSVLKPAENG